MAITSPEIQIATERVKELFASTGMGVDPFEKAIGVSQGTIKSIRNGRNFASADCIIKVAKYFNVSVDYILGFTDEPKPLSPTVEEHSKNSVVKRTTTEIAEKFIGEFGELISDEIFYKIAKTYSAINNVAVRAQILVVIVAYLNRNGINTENIIGY